MPSFSENIPKAEKMIAAFRSLQAEYLSEGKEREAAAVGAARVALESASISIIARLYDLSADSKLIREMINALEEQNTLLEYSYTQVVVRAGAQRQVHAETEAALGRKFDGYLPASKRAKALLARLRAMEDGL